MAIGFSMRSQFSPPEFMSTNHKGVEVTISCLIKRFFAIGLGGLFLGLMSIGSAIAAGPGPDTCVKCHEEEVASYSNSIHGAKGNARGAANAGECSSCHGDGSEHVKARGKVAMQNPGKKSMSSVDSAATCIACHKSDNKRSHWEGSTHQNRDVTCADCHKVHAAKDKALAKVTQSDVCFTCHAQQRSEFYRPSRHPIAEGKVGCSDCHNVHGSVGPKLVKKDSTVETCYQCHAEKRGPFVHNHAPVVEDCGNCHNPHGTVADSLLKMRQPFLCHTCHTPHGGQVLQVTGQVGPAVNGVLPAPNNRTATSGGKDGVNITQARGCLNCHTQVHGGNNPSATNPTPQFMFR
jgi:DmsE family decaheme c-type cytochrome